MSAGTSIFTRKDQAAPFKLCWYIAACASRRVRAITGLSKYVLERRSAERRQGNIPFAMGSGLAPRLADGDLGSRRALSVTDAAYPSVSSRLSRLLDSLMSSPRSFATSSAFTMLMLRDSALVMGDISPFTSAAKSGFVVFAEAREPE